MSIIVIEQVSETYRIIKLSEGSEFQPQHYINDRWHNYAGSQAGSIKTYKRQSGAKALINKHIATDIEIATQKAEREQPTMNETIGFALHQDDEGKHFAMVGLPDGTIEYTEHLASPDAVLSDIATRHGHDTVKISTSHIIAYAKTKRGEETVQAAEVEESVIIEAFDDAAPVAEEVQGNNEDAVIEGLDDEEMQRINALIKHHHEEHQDCDCEECRDEREVTENAASDAESMQSEASVDDVPTWTFTAQKYQDEQWIDTTNTVQAETNVEEGLTLPEALRQSSVVYKRDGDGYYVASKANLSSGYFLDFKSFDPLKHSSVSTSQYHVSIEDIAQHTARGWQLDEPTQDTLVHFAVVATPDGVQRQTTLHATPDEVLADVARQYGHNTINVSLERVQECSTPLQQQEMLQHTTFDHERNERETAEHHIIAGIHREYQEEMLAEIAKQSKTVDDMTQRWLQEDIENGTLDHLDFNKQVLPSWAMPDEQASRPMQQSVQQQQMQSDEPMPLQSVLDTIQEHINKYEIGISYDKECIGKSYAEGQTNVDYLCSRIAAKEAQITALLSLEYELNVDHSSSEGIQADDTTNYYRGLGL